MIQKIIGGANTGTERAAMEAALDCDISCGGALLSSHEDSRLADLFFLTPLSGDYAEKIAKNTELSEGTMLFYDRTMTEYTQAVQAYCQKNRIPCTGVDYSQVNTRYAVNEVRDLVLRNKISILHVTGSSAEDSPRAYPFVYNVISEVIDHNLIDSLHGGRISPF
jgi:hypothetical protein